MTMREILFRGKSLRGVNWVEGSLLIFPKTKRAKILVYEEADLDFNNVEVNPATVGQYTGLTDKNGKRIFEGDVVRITIPVKDAKPITQISHVYYSNGCFCVNWCRGYPEHHRTRLDDFCYSVAFEVIGNIHDNPELLKGGES